MTTTNDDDDVKNTDDCGNSNDDDNGYHDNYGNSIEGDGENYTIRWQRQLQQQKLNDNGDKSDNTN